MATVIVHPAIAQMQAPGQSAKEIAIGDSSFIQHAKYDPASFQLTVTMKNGGQYTHYYVYPATFDQFQQSASKGKFYSENIKGKTPSVRLVNKTVGPQHRDPKKGPVNHHQKKGVPNGNARNH